MSENPKDPVPREQRADSVYSIPGKDCEHGQTKRHFGTGLKDHQKAVFLVKKEIQPCRNMLAKPTIQLAQIILKLLPPTGDTINAFVWKLWISRSFEP